MLFAWRAEEGRHDDEGREKREEERQSQELAHARRSRMAGEAQAPERDPGGEGAEEDRAVRLDASMSATPSRQAMM